MIDTKQIAKYLRFYNKELCYDDKYYQSPLHFLKRALKNMNII